MAQIRKGISPVNQSEFEAFSDLLATAADYYGKSLAPSTIQLYWNALSRLDLVMVQRLVNEHVKHSRFMPTIAELLDAMKALDGRPGAEEAWAMIPKTEGGTVVWTDEMSHAFGVAFPLLDEDQIAARMAFKEAYQAAVQRARDAGAPVKWTPSLGYDVGGREGPLLEAARRGRLTVQHVRGLLPYRDVPPEVQQLLEQAKAKELAA